ncbi:MAG: TIR domain-containing protein [Verrucomicrobia bacterium]|nr:TIR domain-containing protein [Verrucomicrobiota bacterium]
MPPPTSFGAVFLSYAREDADAARRIAEALRGFGMDVWFDQHELRGGDAWDAKIRSQIRDCALFIPIISANTQARGEGYFRREWKLAAERTSDMAQGIPFVVPVVVDETPERAAAVPDEFMRVQWTRLPHGVPTPEFVAQVRRLLQAPRTPALVAATGPARQAVSLSSTGNRAIRLAALALGAIGAGGVLLWMIPSERKFSQQEKSSPGAVAAKDNQKVNRQEPQGPNEASRLIAQAREVVYDIEGARSEFALAESLLKRAIDLAPDSAEAWGLSALLNMEYVTRTFDRSESRYGRARADAEKALHIDAKNPDALIALAKFQKAKGNVPLAKQLLERARVAHPKSGRVYVELGRLIETTRERFKFNKESLDLVEDNRELLYHSSNMARGLRLWREAVDLSDKLLKQGPSWRAYVGRSITEYYLTADPQKVSHWLDMVPEMKRDEPRAAVMRFRVAMLRRDAAQAERALSVVSSDYIEDATYTGPRALLLAEAREISDRPESAVNQWRLAEEACRARLKALPDDRPARVILPLAVAGQKRFAEARELADSFRSGAMAAHAYVLIGDHSQAIARLRASLPGIQITAATLRAEPRWDALRKHPDYPALLQALTDADASARARGVDP